MNNVRPAAGCLPQAFLDLIARRVRLFAQGWIATLVVWLAVFVASGRLTAIGAAMFLMGNAVLLMSLGLSARRRPVSAWIRVWACGVCVVLGLALGMLGPVTQVPGDVLAFVLLSLYLMSGLLFAWGWRVEAVLIVGTMLPLGLMISAFEFLVAPIELATALVAGAGLCLAVAEGASRSFQVAFLERASATEAAEAVTASRNAYRDLAENAGDNIYSGDLAGRIVYVNAAAARTIGRPADELVGTSVLELVTDHPENPTPNAMLDGMIADDGMALWRIQSVTSKGPRWFEARVSLIYDVDGKATGVRGVGRDIDERVHAERRLHESEERYRSLVEAQHEAIVRFDLQGQITFANEYWLRRIGASAEEVAGKDQLHLVHPDDLADVSERLRDLRAGAARQTRRYRVRTVDGYRWFEWESGALVGTSGRALEFQAVGRDVHEHHLAEQALRASEARYRVLVESRQALLSRSDARGVLTFVNDHLCVAMGWSREELLGRSLFDYVHPDDRPTTGQMIEELASPPHQARPHEIRVRTGSGFRWFEWEGVGVVDDTGALVEIQSLGRDVTERRQAQDELRTSEARYRGLVESQHELVFRGDTEGRTIFVNDAYCQMCGIRREDLLGQSFAPRVHPDDLEPTVAMLEQLQKPPYRGAIQNRTIDANGLPRWIEWEGCGITDQTGRIVEVQAVGRDVTERKLGEEALERSLEDLERSQDQLRALAQRQVAIREQERKRLGLDLHDDVCQELVGIGILLASIRHRLGPISTENAQGFERVGGYLDQLVDHLRLLARDLQPLQLHDLGLEGGLQSLVRGFASPTCTVEAVFPTPIPRVAEVTEVGVYRIAQEALTNAVRHAEAGQVCLMLAVVGDKLRLEVSDDGRGFDPDERTNALGLVSMEERALSIAGRLTIWSTKGDGTTVRLECPIGDRQTSASAA